MSEASAAASAAPEESVAGDTYWLLESATLLLFNALGGLFVQGEESVPKTGPVLMVSNHTSYLDPCAIGDASPRRVVFMAKAELFENKFLARLLRGVDSFPVRRGEADRGAFKNTFAMLADNRVVCIFPEGTRGPTYPLRPPEPGASLFATRTGAPVVPVYVTGTNKMLALDNKFRPAKVTVAFGEPFTLPKKTDKEEAGAQMMDAIARTRDHYAEKPARRLWPRFGTAKPFEGSRARKA